MEANKPAKRVERIHVGGQPDLSQFGQPDGLPYRVGSHSGHHRSRKPIDEQPQVRELTDGEMGNMKGGCCGGVYFNFDLLGLFHKLKSLFGDPVNILDGNFVSAPGPDIVTRNTRGTPVIFRRYYNSRDFRVGPMGQGWTFDWNVYLTFPPQPPGANRQVILQGQDDSQVTYTQPTDSSGNPIPGQLTPPLGERSTLVQDATGIFTLTEINGTKYYFNSSGTLLSVADSDGNAITCSYDGSGHLTGLTDASGQTTTIAWDAGGSRINSVTGPSGRQVVYGYDFNGNLNSVNCWDGRWIKYTYTSDGGVMTAIQSVSGTEGISYEAGRAAGFMNVDGQSSGMWWLDGTTVIVHPEGDTASGPVVGSNTQIRTFNAEGQPTGVILPDGRSVSIDYDAVGNVSSVTGPTGDTCTYSYDSNDNLIAWTDQEGNTTQYTYNANNDITSSKDAFGNVTRYGYDAHRHVVSVTDAQSHTATSQYDGYGELISRTTPEGRTTSYAYDNRGNVTNVTDPSGQSITLTYDNFGNIISQANSDGQTYGFKYDVADRPIEFDKPDGSTGKCTYCPFGIASVSDAEGRVTQFTYTSTGKPQTITDPAGRTVSYTYTPLGQLASVTDANGDERQYVYDGLERLSATTQSYPASSFPSNPAYESSVSYGLDSQPASVTDANGVTKQFRYDSRGQLSSMIYPDGTGIGYTHDALGETTSVYNLASQAVQTTEAESGVNVTTGNGTWNVVQAQGASGGAYLQCTDAPACIPGDLSTLAPWVQFSFTGTNVDLVYARTEAGGAYGTVSVDGKNVGEINFWSGNSTLADRFGQVFHCDGLSNSPHTVRVTWSGRNLVYGGNVNPSFAALPSAINIDAIRVTTDGAHSNTVAYQYDSVGALRNVTLPNNLTASYSYTPDGFLASKTDYGGGIWSYRYNIEGQIQSLTNGFGETTSTQYDMFGRPTKLVRANGVETDYTYDQVTNRLSEMLNKNSSGSVISSYSYTYNALGQVTRLTYLDGATIDYTYDDSGHLINEVKKSQGNTVYTEAWSYDGAGNRITQTVNGVTTNYTYDSKNRLLTAGDASYAYDNNGNLTNESTVSGAVTYQYDFENRLISTSTGDTYSYDALGNRSKKVSGGVETDFLYDAGGLWGETDASGNVQAVYTGGISQRRGTTSSFYTGDALGSVRELTDSSGNVTDHYDYDAWGNQTASSGSTANPHRYVGSAGYYTDSSDRQFLTNRYYRPSLGRFQTSDPAGDAGGLNHYAYADGDPTDEIDPLGLWGKIAIAVIDALSLAILITALGLEVPVFIFCAVTLGIAAFDHFALGECWGTALMDGGIQALAIAAPEVLAADGLLAADVGVDLADSAPGELPSAVSGEGEGVPVEGDPSESGSPADAGSPADGSGTSAGQLSSGDTSDSSDEADPNLWGGNCFVAGTPVQMANGTLKPIEEVHVGDTVVSWNCRRGIAEPERVSKTFVNHSDNLVKLTIRESDHREKRATVICTGTHPIYVKNRGFVFAEKLAPGMQLLSGNNEPVEVAECVKLNGSYAKATRVYNFLVNNDHDYFVTGFDKGICVHNTSAADILARNMRNTYGIDPPGPRMRWRPHHMVPWNHPRAASARQMLQNVGIDPNDAINGIYLPQSGFPRGIGLTTNHVDTYTHAYIDKVTSDLAAAPQTRAGIEGALGRIQAGLASGTY